jgi:choline dehydrogenase-like flavoprotein
MMTITHPFTPQQLDTLRLVCDTLIPAVDHTPDPHGLYARPAHMLNVAETLMEALKLATTPSEILQVQLFLTGLELGAINGAVASIWKPFAEMTLAERTQTLQKWASGIEPQRKAFQLLKRLSTYLFYAIVDEHGRNPAWEAIGYSGPPPKPTETPRPIQPIRITEDTVLFADVVIVGSGAGGGVMAGMLSAGGLDVIVVEKGGYHTESDYDGYEVTSNPRLYEKFGMCATDDLSVVIQAGSTLGGGTIVNWNVSLRTPDHVLDQWSKRFGVTFPNFQAEYEAICARLNVNLAESEPSPQNNVLLRGGEALNHPVDCLPRNVQGCVECGFCNYGCVHGAKQSTLRTFLQDAHGRGGRIVVNCHVERVLIEQGHAVGVSGWVQRDTDRHSVTIRAKKVIVSGGALQTPALLLRSGLGNPNIGRNLHLHPTTITYGIYDQRIEGWRGAPMTRIISKFSDLTGDGYGFILETAPVHPGIAAVSVPWENGAQHKSVMEKLNHLSNILVITRDREGGRVTVDRKGRPHYHYKLGDRDQHTMAEGVREALRVHVAAGAKEISAPHSPPLTALINGSPEESLNRLFRQIEQRGYQPNRYALFSAHQMSSARMGSNPTLGVVDPSGESFEVRHLYVADGAALPTSVGRNPMITIMTVAACIARGILAE